VGAEGGRARDERTHRDDPAYGFRKLVDVAQRSLGTAQNDATTAVQVINRLHDGPRLAAGGTRKRPGGCARVRALGAADADPSRR
jgi:uncharacterized membrane protein